MEKPILFKGEMVRAILSGQKTQTRRIMKVPTGWEPDGTLGRIKSTHPKKGKFGAFIRTGVGTDFPQFDIVTSPYGTPGDSLWVRETFKSHGFGTWGIHYKADKFTRNDKRASIYDEMYETKWRPSIFMPRWASRMDLDINSIRVERLQNISDKDAIAEGIEQSTHIGPMRSMGWKDYSGGPGFFSPANSFSSLWDSINGTPRANGADISWSANPLLWVVEFTLRTSDKHKEETT